MPDEVAGGFVVLEDELVQVRAVLTGRDDRPLGDGASVVGPVLHREAAVVGQVGVTRDDRVDVGRGVLDDVAPRRRGVGEARPTQQAVDGEPSWTSRITRSAGVGTGLQLGRRLVGRVDDVGDGDALDAGRVDQGRKVLGDRTDEADLHAVDGLDPGLRELVRLPLGLLDVGGDVLPVRTVLDATDEVRVAAVELVVACGRDLEAHGVERVDGRLVVLDEGLEGRGADEVTGGDEHRVRVLRLELLHRGGERCSTGGVAGVRAAADRGSRWCRGPGSPCTSSR